MTTPIQFEIDTLEAEATELLLRADRKEQMAGKEWAAGGAKALLRDAEIFREEAASKRAKADRLRKAAHDAEARHALEREGAGQHETLDEANPFAQ